MTVETQKCWENHTIDPQRPKVQSEEHLLPKIYKYVKIGALTIYWKVAYRKH